MKFFYSFIFFFFISCSAQKDLSLAENLWKTLPVQHEGRIKPFDTFSRETLRQIYGKDHYKKRSAVEVILLWLLVPDMWDSANLVFVEKDIKKSLNLDLKQKHFSVLDLSKNSKLSLQLSELQSLRQQSTELDSYFQQIEKLETRLILFSAVKSGYLISLEPQKDKSSWLSLPELTPSVQKQITQVIKSYIALISKNIPSEFKNSSQLSSLDIKDSSSSKESFSEFKNRITQFKSLFIKDKKIISQIKAEVFYNSLKPFNKAWVFYLLFLLAYLVLVIFKQEKLFKYTMPFVFIAFGFHALGMIFRSYIMARPPVSNMYETVIWVPFVALIAGFVFYLRGNKWPFIASAILSFFCLLLSSLAPEVLDGRLQPLEAVLRSSFWLTTHVLTITMSYSFFFLAFVLGDIALISYLINKKEPLGFVEKMSQAIYRSIQWGVVFLAGGTILGGIWADYSWGRFWGWDPKESWALISLLAYLALLHGKLIGWVSAFNLSLFSVLIFFLVIMAWYGVNFVLGAGLHSYGFGSGGIEYVSAFLVLHLILCALAIRKKFISS
ncbi:MAG: cytochrome c biogenesis protein CcsA [Bdellovibrionaceae bacterium]|nr:cytochrome c biogenesis protein CcsA [Pseudobdellovibrionaceae bacterium]